MRLAAANMSLATTVTEEELLTLREGDKLLVPVDFIGWDAGSTRRETGTTLMRIGLPLIQLNDRFVKPRPTEMQIFGAQVHSVQSAPPAPGDIVRYEAEWGGDATVCLGKVIAVDGEQALVRQVRPLTRARRLLEIDKLHRARRPDDLTAEEKAALA